MRESINLPIRDPEVESDLKHLPANYLVDLAAGAIPNAFVDQESEQVIKSAIVEEVRRRSRTS